MFKRGDEWKREVEEGRKMQQYQQNFTKKNFYLQRQRMGIW